MATWGEVAVSWPDGPTGAPVLTFPLPTGLPAVSGVTASGADLPDRTGAQYLSSLPQPQARNLAPPRARWDGAGLFQIYAYAGDLIAGAVSAPFTDPVVMPLWAAWGSGVDFAGGQEIRLRAYVELMPPGRNVSYGGELYNPLSAKGFWFFDLNSVIRRDTYPTDYPTTETDAYGKLIAGTGVAGQFGEYAPALWIAPGEAFPDSATMEVVFYPATIEVLEAPAVTVQAPAPEAGGGGGETGGGGTGTGGETGGGETGGGETGGGTGGETGGGGTGTGGEPAPAPAPPVLEPARTFALAWQPNWIDGGGELFASATADADAGSGAPTGDRTFAAAAGPGRPNPDQPVRTGKGRWEPTYRQFWQQLYVGSKLSAKRTHKILRKTRMRGRRRRR